MGVTRVRNLPSPHLVEAIPNAGADGWGQTAARLRDGAWAALGGRTVCISTDSWRLVAACSWMRVEAGLAGRIFGLGGPRAKFSSLWSFHQMEQDAGLDARNGRGLHLILVGRCAHFGCGTMLAPEGHRVHSAVTAEAG